MHKCLYDYIYVFGSRGMQSILNRPVLKYCYENLQKYNTAQLSEQNFRT